MPRPLRLDIEGGWYHGINRGLEKRLLFPDKRANGHFLDLPGVLPIRFVLNESLGVTSKGRHSRLQEYLSLKNR